MPYLPERDKEHYRRLLEPLLKNLESESPQYTAGVFNFIITSIALKITTRRYWSVALTVGTILCAILEFYRRFAAPYEDEKIKENGDVYGN